MNANIRFGLQKLGLALCFGFGFLVFSPALSLATADTTAPVVGAITPTTATATTMTTFSATYSDAVGVSSCMLYVSGMPAGTMALGSSTTSGTATYGYMTGPAGSITAYAVCTDAAGNSGTGSSTTVTVSASSSSSSDTTAPTVGSVSPTTGTEFAYQTFSASYADSVGVTSCTLYLDSASQGTMTLSGGSGSTSGTATLYAAPPDNGTDPSWVTCVDAAGNVGTGAVTYVAVASPDTTAPTVGSITPLTITATVATTLSATYSDAVGVSSCTLYVSGSSVGAMTLGSSTTSGTATYSYTASTTGSVSVQAKCTDTSGNTGSGTSKTLVITGDTTAPTVGSITPTTATAGTAATLSATYSDNIAVTGCTLYVGGVSQGAMTLASGTASKSYTFSTSGTFNAKATCVDAAGNSKSGTVTSITVAASSSSTDTTAPTVGSVTPTTATAGTASTFTAAVSDAVGVSTCSLYVGSTNVGAMTVASGYATLSYTPSASGTLSVYVSCKDAAGNSGTGSATTVTVAAAASADTTAPTVGAITPTTATAGVATTFSATYSDAVGVTSCTAYVDGSAKSMALASGTASASGTFDAAGDYSVYMTCTDAAGNVGTGSTVTVKVSAVSTDTTAPTISAMTPTTATQNTAVTFSATATDDSGIYECRLFVNDSDQGQMTASSSTYSRSYTAATSGTLTAYAWCGDGVGNIGAGTAVTVTVAAAATTTTDTVAPTVGVITPTSVTAGTATTLSASVADSGGMGTCTLYVNSTNIGAMSISGGYATYLYTFAAEGSAIANAYCVDAAGNATRGASTTITIASETSTTTETTAEEDVAVGEADVDSLIKLACGSDADVEDPCHAVYYYDGKRHAFPNEKVYFTWYENFDDVIIVTDDFLSSITLGVNVTYHPGTTMVKFVSVNTVYAVGETGELRAIASEDVAASIWGSDWNTQIDDISDAFYGNYHFGDDINSTSDFDPDAVESSVTNIIDILQV